MFKIAISIAVLVLVSCFIYYQSQRPKLASLDDVNALFYRQTGFHRINRMQVKEAVEIDKKIWLVRASIAFGLIFLRHGELKNQTRFFHMEMCPMTSKS